MNDQSGRLPPRVPVAIRYATLLAMVAAVMLIGAAFGQIDAGDPGAPARAGSVAADAGGSFAEAFFVSYRTDPGGERSLELLGSLVIWFLILLSMLSIGLIMSMAWSHRRSRMIPPDVVEAVRAHIGSGRFGDALALTEQDASFFGQIMFASMSEASHGFGAVIRRLELAADELTTNHLRRVEHLNVVGQVSPMIGLFGTVYGMILAFRSIVMSGGNADPILLAGGIGTALTTTFWGLVVAIPALAAYAIIRNRIDACAADATLQAEQIMNQLRPKPADRKVADKR